MKVFCFFVLVLALIAFACSTPCRNSRRNKDDDDFNRKKRDTTSELTSITSDMASPIATPVTSLPSLPSLSSGIGNLASGLSGTGGQLMKGLSTIPPTVGKVTTPIVNGTANGIGAVLDGAKGGINGIAGLLGAPQ